MEKLKFGVGGNAKLDKNIATFSLLSGYSCPGADKCYTKVIIDNNGKKKIEDGKHQEFRCFSASQEVLYAGVYNNRSHNYNIILNIVKDKSKTYNEKVETIHNLLKISLPQLHKWDILRLHVGGDIFCLEYFDALIQLAKDYSNKLFYAYTKSVHLWVKRLNEIPDNFILTASYGGKYDDLIDKYNLKSVKVVMSNEEAEMWNLEIDHDDSHAYEGKDNFALLLHGSQKKDTNASKALSALKKSGWTGYNQKSKNIMNNSMLNLTQYASLKYYLIELGLELNLIKDIKKINNPNKYITFHQGEVIYSDVTILNGITFLYNDSVYDVYSVLLPGSSLVKWICNCDINIKDMFTYNDFVNIPIKEEIADESKVNDYNWSLMKNYYFIGGSMVMYIFKKYLIGDKFYYVQYGKLVEIPNNNYDRTDFDNYCNKLGILPNPIIQKLYTNFISYNEVNVFPDNIEGRDILNYPVYKVDELVTYNDTEQLTILDMNINRKKSTDELTWIYSFYECKEWYDESLLSKCPFNKSRPDLISPYFLSSFGKFLNNKKNFNKINNEDIINQHLMQNIIAYNQQRLYGLDDNFKNTDFLLEIAHNVMSLVHFREVKKIKDGI